MPGQSQILDEHWTGILPLAPPHAITPWILLSSVVLLLLVLSVVYLLWRRAPRQRALRTLRHCHRQLHTRVVDPKLVGKTAYRCLLQGMGLNPATSHIVADDVKKDWHTFYQQFQFSVFQASSPAKDELDGLILQACEWLRRGLR